MKIFWAGLFLLFSLQVGAECQQSRIKVQVLGSGGPEITDQRASTSYLIWLDDKGIIMLDTGPGSMLNYEKSAAHPNDLAMVLYSHLHVDHSAELPALIKGFYFTGRDQDLLIIGPTGNQLLPPTDQFVADLFSNNGLYPYLSNYFGQNRVAKYHIKVKTVDISKTQIQTFENIQQGISLSAVSVHHGPLPALAWRIDVAGCRLVFSGDMSNHYHRLSSLAQQVDLLVAHHAIPEQTKGVARQLHMPPSEIGRIAGKAKVKKLVLSHRMSRTLGKEAESRRIIAKRYSGPILFSDDLDSFVPGN